MDAHLQQLDDIHFNLDYGVFDDSRQAHKPTLYSLLAVAAFLLLLACINFINLTTAQASQRAKEIGIRKTMEANRSQLTFQFLTETFVLTLLATILSILLTPFLLKMFADFIPDDFHFNLLPAAGGHPVSGHPGFRRPPSFQAFTPPLSSPASNLFLVLKNQAFAHR